MEIDRAEAARDDNALIRYQAHWERALERMQRRHPSRWSVRGWSPEEVRDALTLRLLEVVRGDPAEQPRYERDGKEWAIVVMRARLAELRKVHRLDERVADIPDAPARLPPHVTEEERFIEDESAALRASARARAEASLTQPQRRWYAAMRMAANAGEFFEASDTLNLSAAARLLDKNRSSAQRAYEELKSTFTRELERDE